MKPLLIAVLCGLLLVLFFACTGPGNGEIGVDRAVEIVQQHLSLVETSDSTQTNRIIFYVQRVSSGDQIREDNPFTPQAAQEVVGDGYFFLVDCDPLARFTHDVRYVVVSCHPGEILINQGAQWTPTVNGTPVLTGEIYSKGYAANVWQNFENHTLGSVSRKNTLRQVPRDLEPDSEVEGSIVVNGNDPGRYPDVGISTDAGNMGNFYDGFDVMSETQKLSPPDNKESDLEDALQDMQDAGVEDCSIYIVSHGGSDVLVMGESTMTATELCSMLSDFPDITFKVMIDACKSGSFLDDLEDEPNVAIAVTATDDEKGSYGDIDGPSDPNPEDTGGEWTSGFLEDLEQYTDPGTWLEILGMAEANDVSPKVVLYYMSFDSAWDKDYARILGLSNPQRYSPNYE